MIPAAAFLPYKFVGELFMESYTIAAIATALSNSGIGIIRVSGDDAVNIVNRIFVNKKFQYLLKHVKSHTIHYGFIIDENNEVIDEVLVSYMKSPNSFTAEDTVEINCHGGILVMKRILDLVIRNGARLAEPGEFTKRAFLNGRIDLSKAEAVMDVISSKNDLALKSSMKQLRGSVYHKIADMRKSIIYEIAFIESALDDPEHISLEGYPETLRKKINLLSEDISHLLSTAEDGKIIKDGIRTVIVGKPNAGKSSLLNILVGEEKAIVTMIPGTTRDVLEEDISIDGMNLHITDTAGIRQTKDVVESIGVEKARKYASDADLVIYVVDSSMPLDDSDIEIMEMIKDKKCIILFNKSDLENQVSIDEIKDKTGNHRVIIKSSMKDHFGIEEFKNEIKHMFLHGDIFSNDELIITNIRHKEALQEVKESLDHVMDSLDLNMPEDFYSIDLMSAYKSLGKIIGEDVEDDLVNEIFSKFCMGK